MASSNTYTPPLAKLLLVVALSLTTLSGCNYFILAGYLLGGPPSVEPKYEKATGKSLTDKDVVVAVVCYAPKEVRWAHVERVDQDIAKYVSHKLHQHHVVTIQPGRVNEWIDENPHWDNPEEIGVAVGATHVVYIDLHSYAIYEPNSSNLYRGQAEAVIAVHEVDEDGNGDQIFSTDLTSKFPLMGPRSTSEVSENTFKRQYLSRLSEEIGRLFYEHYNGDDFYDAL